ncbi:hypothetical protein LCGC14_1654770, partial [marine sediment metagenome]
MSKGPIILGIGSVIAAFGYFWNRKKEAQAEGEATGMPSEAEEETPEEATGMPSEAEEGTPAKGRVVTVSIKNPPSAAQQWQLTIYDVN